MKRHFQRILCLFFFLANPAWAALAPYKVAMIGGPLLMESGGIVGLGMAFGWPGAQEFACRIGQAQCCPLDTSVANPMPSSCVAHDKKNPVCGPDEVLFCKTTELSQAPLEYKGWVTPLAIVSGLFSFFPIFGALLYLGP